ncbi:MAG: pyridoxine/pyridoxamine 5'-phosphate oxidase [Rhodoglobus sp.]
MSESSIRDLLRSVASFPSDLPDFDPTAAPQDPFELFSFWLAEACTAGVAQPHAMALATCGPGGQPSLRTLLLKDVTDAGFWFASVGDSPKGREIAANPKVALTFYWREQGRQVRVTGDVSVGPREVAAADFLSRNPQARATVIAGRQSDRLPEASEVRQVVERARARIAEHPETVPDNWNAYVVRPRTVEFWQASRAHDQIRLHYSRADDCWSMAQLWP